MTSAGGTTEVMSFPFVLHAGAVLVQADSGFLGSAVAVAPAALEMTKVVRGGRVQTFIFIVMPGNETLRSLRSP